MAKQNFTGVTPAYPASKTKLGEIQYGAPKYDGPKGSPLAGLYDAAPRIGDNKLGANKIVKVENPPNSDSQRSKVSHGPGPTFSDKRVKSGK